MMAVVVETLAAEISEGVAILAVVVTSVAAAVTSAEEAGAISKWPIARSARSWLLFQNFRTNSFGSFRTRWLFWARGSITKATAFWSLERTRQSYFIFPMRNALPISKRCAGWRKRSLTAFALTN
jgi:hypothetical protein